MATLAEVKNEAEKLAPLVREKRAAFEAAKARAQREVPVEKLLNTTTPEFQALDSVGREYSDAAERYENARAAVTRLAELEGTASVDAIGSSHGDAAAAQAADLVRQGVASNLLVRAARATTSSDDYRALLASGILNTNAGPGTRSLKRGALNRDEAKALLVTGTGATQGGAFTTNDRQAAMVELPVRPLSITDLITVGQTDSDVVEFVRQTARAVNAAMVPEAADTTGTTGRKPESGLAFEVVTTNVKTAAHFIPATRRSVADAGQLQTLIEQGLEYGLLELVENQVVAGSGTGENLLGIMNTSGINNYTRGGTESRLDAIHKAITLVRLQNIEPTVAGLHPNDWQDIRLERDAGTGAYSLGPANAGIAENLFGIVPHVSAAYTENVGVVGNYRIGATLWLREGVNTFITDSNRDWFELNILAILAEMRLAFGVTQPRAFATASAL